MKVRFWMFLTVLVMAVAANAQVVINEIYYDSPGTDVHCFTELKGTPGTDLTGYKLVGVNGAPGTSQGPYDSLTLSGTIPASGLFVIAQDTTVLNYNLISTHVDWQNAGSTTTNFGDNLLLKNPAGAVIDAVGYGSFADSTTLWTGEPANNRLHSAPDPFPSGTNIYSIGRIPDGSDTGDNSVDFQSLNPPSPGVANSTGTAPTPVARTLLQIRTNNTSGVPSDSGTYIITHGVANVPSGLWATGGLLDISIQDGQSAGVTVRGQNNTTVNIGDSITVQGYVSHYNGKTQIVPSATGSFLVVTNHGPTGRTVQPLVVTTGELRNAGEQYEGMLVRINNSILGSNQTWPIGDSARSINIDDGTGVVTLRIEALSHLGTAYAYPPTPGAVLNSLVGIAGQYDITSPYTEYFQISPRNANDITYTNGVHEIGDATMAKDFSLNGAFPNPFNSSIELHYSVTRGEQAAITVYDLSGRIVATLGDATAGVGVVRWNGKNTAGNSVSAGTYIVRMTGKTHTASQKVVYLP